MRTKLIFLDIDGTLTEPGKNVPPDSALEAIRRAREKGHRVVLCSGRNYGMLSPLLPFGFDGLVGSAGGYIAYGGQVIYDCPMTLEQQERLLDGLVQSGVFYTVEGKERSYTIEGFKEFLQKRQKGGSELLRWREQLERNLGIRPMAEFQGEPVYKVLFMCQEQEQLRRLEEAFGDEFDFCIQDAGRYGLINVELINRKFNKGTAVRRLCEYTGTPLEDTIAFGDSMNDLEMLETAGLGVSMANGSEALKAVADAICPSVGEDGLYRGFERHGLI